MTYQVSLWFQVSLGSRSLLGFKFIRPECILPFLASLLPLSLQLIVLEFYFVRKFSSFFVLAIPAQYSEIDCIDFEVALRATNTYQFGIHDFFRSKQFETVRNFRTTKFQSTLFIPLYLLSSTLFVYFLSTPLHCGCISIYVSLHLLLQSIL